jgi:hypothetical protein
MKKIQAALRRFFFPPHGSPRWMMVLPYAVLGILTILVVTGGVYTWDYTNSPGFCGKTCHTMPPQNATYLASPHANIYCTECHIGRGVFGTQISRKTEDVYEIYAMVFHQYTFPIQATRTRPARQTCEQCHQPQSFSADSLQIITHFHDDVSNTPYYTYLILKTGGGTKQEGLGNGIHWHIENKVDYYATDALEQNIPYVRVYNADGTFTEYIDVSANFDPATLSGKYLKEMDCITCHNRITHNFPFPADSVDSAMSRGLISPTIPDIKAKSVELLSIAYTTQQSATEGIAGLDKYYQQNYADFYAKNQDLIHSAITELETIYNQTVFIDQEVNWTTHPNNLGHINSAGCFRCHDGKHLTNQGQSIPLECNLCHSIPVVASSSDFVTKIEISRGPEPDTHFNSNWISLHNQVVDATCSNCHTVADPGGTSNTSFCSNSACHGSKYNFAGFDAPALRKILQAQLPTPAPNPTPAPVVGGIPTFIANIGPIFALHCTGCHNNTNPTAGLNLTTYTTALKGSTNGPVITPGDATNSKLIQVQSAQHFANLSAAELDLVRQWIVAGAPEK